MSTNVVVLVGRLTRDVDLRYTSAGDAVANFTLAVDRSHANKAGDREADFIDVTCWRKLAEAVANHTAKGQQVAVAGRLQTRTYEAKDGGKRKAVEVVADEVQFLSRPKGGAPEADGRGDEPAW